MAGLLIYPRGDGMLTDIGEAWRNLLAPPDVPVALGVFATHDGPRVLLALPLPQSPGRWVTSEISLELLLTAADAAVQAHGDPRERDRCLRCGAPVEGRHPV